MEHREFTLLGDVRLKTGVGSIRKKIPFGVSETKGAGNNPWTPETKGGTRQTKEGRDRAHTCKKKRVNNERGTLPANETNNLRGRSTSMGNSAIRGNVQTTQNDTAETHFETKWVLGKGQNMPERSRGKSEPLCG